MQNNYYKLNEDEKKVLKKIENITFTNYEIEAENFIKVDNIMVALRDIVCHYMNKEEELEDMIQDMADNYKRISPEEQV